MPRNVPDDILQQLPKNGGVVMVTFVPGFISPEVAAVHARDARASRRSSSAQYPERPEPAASRRAEAVARGATPSRARRSRRSPITSITSRKVAGIDHIGLGGDFDGITSVAAGLEDVSKYPALTAELLRRGYTDEDVRKILGKNILRVMRQAETVAASLEGEAPAGAVIK